MASTMVPPPMMGGMMPGHMGPMGMMGPMGGMPNTMQPPPGMMGPPPGILTYQTLAKKALFI